MAEQYSESAQAHAGSPQNRSNVVIVAAIAAAAIVALACIAACTLTMYVFLSNAPW